MLSDLNLKQHYRSDDCNIIEEFYMPCLKESILYQRAVGYFSSSGLTVAAKGLNMLIAIGGKMELVASPQLSKEDIVAINAGYAKKRELEEKRLLDVIEDKELDCISRERLGFLAWLIANNALDIKIASLKDNNTGIFHEKVGIFFDGSEYVAFSGSPNESSSGLVSNFESIDVFCSWRAEDKSRAFMKKNDFLKLWKNKTNKLSVYPFPEAAEKKLLYYKPSNIPSTDPESVCGYYNEENIDNVSDDTEEFFSIPVDLRKYQEDAISNWFRANGYGTLKMATGSGKTITALSAAQKLYDKVNLNAIIIICPYRHLVNQWDEECRKFGLKPVKCYENKEKWLEELKIKLFNVGSRNIPLCIVTTNNTFSSDTFQHILTYFPKNTMLIGDEVHNLGTTNLINALPEMARFRLGLSATPERWFDEEGTEKIYEYFGYVLEPVFTIKDALKVGALVPYKYHPIFVSLTDDEVDQYVMLSNKIKKVLNLQDTEDIRDSKDSALTALLNQRARLIGSAKNKLSALRTLMKERLNTTHNLFYCGDGTIEDQVSNNTQRQLDAVCKILGNELKFRVDTYTAETTIDERDELQNSLDLGELQGLVAIRCLDEGVDIPSIKTAFIMASSSNPRQFIQRRGRILRPSPNKEQAEIFDMVILPPIEENLDISVEKAIFKKELKRYIEFADLAINAGESMGKIATLQSKLGLHKI